MGESLRSQHLELNRRQAAKAFENHRITKVSDRRWLIQERHPDGKPDWTCAAEIIALEGGGIFVGGDIDHVVFAWGPSDPVARLRWMGECNDLAYYVRQKARIGSRNQDCIDVWDEEIAHEELRAYVEELRAEDGFSTESVDDDYLESALSADTREHFLDSASKAFPDWLDSWEVLGDMGMVLCPSVIYAHAALARLCVLLREVEVSTAVGGA